MFQDMCVDSIELNSLLGKTIVGLYPKEKNLYFPPRLFEVDVTTRYAMWWKQSILGHADFVNNTVKWKRSESSRKHRCHVGKINKSSNDVGVPLEFPLNLVDLLNFAKSCDDVSAESSAFLVAQHWKVGMHCSFKGLTSCFSSLKGSFFFIYTSIFF